MIQSKLFYFIFFLLFTFYSAALSSKAICIGDCSVVPSSVLLGGNLLEPVLNRTYTDSLLHSMGESAVLQNLNLGSGGTRPFSGYRVGLGYAMARSKLETQDLVFRETELRELPNSGVAASSTIQLGFSLDKLFTENSFFSQMDMSFHFFRYPLREDFVPFLKLKNTDLGGKVEDAGIRFRYFPLANWGEKKNDYGLVLGLGFYRSSQELYLDSYDRRTQGIRLPGLRGNWIGLNHLEYNSLIYSSNLDMKFFYDLANFRFFLGLGLYIAEGKMDILVSRKALVGELENSYLSSPTFFYLDINRKYLYQDRNYFLPVGLEYNWKGWNILLEYFHARNADSLNLSIQYYF